jgi:long-chain fatty acid transport protein
MRLTLALIVLWAGQAVPVQAGGFELRLLGVRQLGMGHAGAGFAADAASAWLNPGALCLVPRNSVVFGGGAVTPVTAFLAQTPSVYGAESEFQVLSPIYLHASLGGTRDLGQWRVRFGLSVATPYLSSIRWPDTWKGRFISQEFSFSTLFVQPAVSFTRGSRLGIGLGFSLGWGNLLVRRAIQADGPNGTQGSVRFAGTGLGAGLSLGLLYHVNGTLSLGATLRSGVMIRLRQGSIRFDVPESLESQYPDGTFSASLPLPPSLTLGIGYQPDPRLRLALDLSFYGWESFESLRLLPDSPAYDIQEFPERNFRNTLTLSLGGEYSVNEMLRIRAGWYYDGSPVAQGYVSPELPDATRIGLTAGAGIRLSRHLQIDLAYAYEFTGERTAILDAAVFGGAYESFVYKLGLGLVYAF